MIRVERLVKSFGAQLAVAGLNLEADEGDILGLIGPNGAGKTTTLRILATLEQADAGSIVLAGEELSQDVQKARRLVGFMPERFGLYDELSVRDYLDFFARIQGLDARQRRSRVGDLLELCDLVPKQKDGCGALSKGVRQRLYVAKTLLADPPLLLLDEPASGLDPRARIEFRALLKELAEHGKTILISSHILSELDAVCNRVVVVESGRVRFAGDLDELRQQFQQTLRVEFLPPESSEAAAELLRAREDVEEVELIPGALRVTFTGSQEEVPGLLKALIDAGHPVLSFAVEATGLESLFLQVTEGVVS